jgi:hypothetical protein
MYVSHNTPPARTPASSSLAREVLRESSGPATIDSTNKYRAIQPFDPKNIDHPPERAKRREKKKKREQACTSAASKYFPRSANEEYETNRSMFTDRLSSIRRTINHELMYSQSSPMSWLNSESLSAAS